MRWRSGPRPRSREAATALTGLEQDRTREIGTGYSCLPTARGNIDRMGSRECEGAAGNGNRCGAARSPKVGSYARAIGREHIHADPLAREAVGHLVCRDVRGKPEPLEHLHHDGKDRGTHANIHNKIKVLADARRLLPVLKRVKQHHLAANERPSTRHGHGDIQECFPHLCAVGADRGQIDHAARSAASRRKSARPARTLRSSAASTRSAATTACEATRSPSPNTQSCRGTRSTTFACSPADGARW